ncbi:Sulfoacetaldehyde reductase 2 [Nymphon striatum]|nr:Sulfoacetaldehyde reductase 2 [Nymphon striatum]
MEWLRMIWYSLSVNVSAGATVIESPVCTPIGSTVFDGADDDGVVGRVAHDLHFELFPTQQRFVDQNLANGRSVHAGAAEKLIVLAVVRHAATCSAHGEGRADDRRQADLFEVLQSKGDTCGKVFLAVCIFRRGADGRFGVFDAEAVHGVAEQLAVFCHFNGFACYDVAGVGQAFGDHTPVATRAIEAMRDDQRCSVGRGGAIFGKVQHGPRRSAIAGAVPVGLNGDMMDAKDIASKIEAVQELLTVKFGIKRQPLEKMLKRAGRRCAQGPVGGRTILRFLQGDMGHGAVGRGPVPVFFARFKPDHITGSDMLDRFACFLRQTNACCDDQAEVEQAHGVTAHVFALDLGAEGGARALYDHVKDAGLSVDVLINNAGFGGHGKHLDRPLADEMGMIDLNVKALASLTHMVGQDMVAQGSGRILNVGSTAGFMPGPNQAIYFATKAFVKSFSEALAQEMKGTGVTATLLAPGYVETEFAERADLGGTDLVKGGGKSAASVAKHGYDAMMAGKLVTVNEAGLGFLVNWLIPMMPRKMVLNMVEKMQAK